MDERNLISSSTIFKRKSELLGNVINEWKQYNITLRHRLRKLYQERCSKSRIQLPNLQLFWDFLMSFPNNPGLLFKVVTTLCRISLCVFNNQSVLYLQWYMEIIVNCRIFYTSWYHRLENGSIILNRTLHSNLIAITIIDSYLINRSIFIMHFSFCKFRFYKILNSSFFALWKRGDSKTFILLKLENLIIFSFNKTLSVCILLNHIHVI